MIKKLPAMQETWIWSLGQENPLEKGMATHSCILAWRIQWSLVGYSPWGHKETWLNNLQICTHTHTHMYTHIIAYTDLWKVYEQSLGPLKILTRSSERLTIMLCKEKWENLIIDFWKVKGGPLKTRVLVVYLIKGQEDLIYPRNTKQPSPTLLISSFDFRQFQNAQCNTWITAGVSTSEFSIKSWN